MGEEAEGRVVERDLIGCTFPEKRLEIGTASETLL